MTLRIGSYDDDLRTIWVECSRHGVMHTESARVAGAMLSLPRPPIPTDRHRRKPGEGMTDRWIGRVLVWLAIAPLIVACAWLAVEGVTEGQWLAVPLLVPFLAGLVVFAVVVHRFFSEDS